MAKRLLQSSDEHLAQLLKWRYGERSEGSKYGSEHRYIEEKFDAMGLTSWLHYANILGELESSVTEWTAFSRKGNNDFRTLAPFNATIKDHLGESVIVKGEKGKEDIISNKQPFFVRKEMRGIEEDKSKNSKSRNMEVDTIPETTAEENRDIYSVTFTKDA